MSTNYIDQITDTNNTTHDISEGDSTRIFRATCVTAAGTTAKVATLQTSSRNFSLATGVRVAVTFTYGNSATTPTLNVNSSGAKTIAVAISATAKATGNGTTYNTWGPYETVLFTYDGTYWVNEGSSLSIYNSYNYNNLSNKPTIPTVPTQLVGTTLNTTPTQVAAALANNQNIEIQHTDSTYGTYKFYDFIYDAIYGNVVASIVAKWGTSWLSFELAGHTTDDSWNTYVTTLAEVSNIPTNVSELTNDSGYTTNTGTITSVKTTAGAHTAINVNSGAAEFNVPTKTSHLTNDSGYLTSDSDEKVKVTQYSQQTTYYPILATGIGTATRQIATNGMSFSESGGGVTLDLGLDSNHWGVLSLGGESQYKTTISGLEITANRSLTLPDKSGTIALTSDIPSVTDTKNTAGSTNTSSKIYLIGATSQAANPQTYSHDTAYVGTNGHLYSASKEVLVGGSNASSSVTITPSTTSVYSMSSTGSVTAGTAPSLSMAVDSTDTKKLNITFNAGTTPSTVTLPGRTQVSNLWNGYTAATAAAQTFTGKTS